MENGIFEELLVIIKDVPKRRLQTRMKLNLQTKHSTQNLPNL